MAAKTGPRQRPTPPRPAEPQTALTIAERLQRIEAMARRIDGYVQFMCQVGNANSSSTEATERAVIAFYDQMVISHGELNRIHDEFKLE